MRPGDVQRGLLTLYDLPPQASVDAFLCDAAQAEALLGAPPDREELLLVGEADGDEPAGVSLYLDAALLERVRRAGPAWAEPEHLGDACLLLEGVSHFTYVAYRAERGEPVSELEMEIQAEVDKYALAVWARAALVGRGVGWLRASQALRAALFEDVRFRDPGHTVRGARYRRAHRRAAHVAAEVERRFLRQREPGAAMRALRRFYRRRRAAKLDPL